MQPLSGETRDALREIALTVRRELIHSSLMAMGRTAPNPPVACVVLVKHGRTYRLFSGATEIPGERHAEIVALDHLDAALWSMSHTRMYVTLEPCSVYGRTPPCTRRILNYPDLGRVTIANRDPSLEDGGIRELRDSGRRVRFAHGDVGRTFLTGFHERIRGRGPRLHLKAAVTADDYMSAGPGERLLISGAGARNFTMSLRACLDGVLVGPGTLAEDLPGLDLRLPHASTGWNLAEGSDLLCESMLDFFSGAANRRLKSATEYQPRRLFLAGRPFHAWGDFITKQRSLAERTGKPAELLTGGFTAPGFPSGNVASGDSSTDEILVRDHRRELPPMQAPGFASALRAVLGELGFNEILVEGGPGLLRAFRDELRTGDRIYILKSRKMVLDTASAPGGHNSGGKKIPSYLLDLPLSARFELGSATGPGKDGEDELIVKEIH